MSYRLFRRGLVLGFAALGLAACLGEVTTPGAVQLTPVTIQASASTAEVAGIAVEISASDISPTLVVNLVPDPNTGKWSGSIEVPVGTNRTFTGRAYDVQGNLTHEGATTKDVASGGNSAISLALNPVENGGETGQVPIDVTVINRSLSVSPGSQSVAVGGTVDFTATVEGSSCTPTWASSNPGRAAITSVSGGGRTATVTGKSAGEVSIVANCGGLAAAASLTVN